MFFFNNDEGQFFRHLGNLVNVITFSVMYWILRNIIFPLVLTMKEIQNRIELLLIFLKIPFGCVMHLYSNVHCLHKIIHEEIKTIFGTSGERVKLRPERFPYLYPID